MKIILTILFLSVSGLACSQTSTVYKRKWTDLSTLTLYPNATFKEIHSNFSCGNYAESFDDTIFEGCWIRRSDTLFLSFSAKNLGMIPDSSFRIDSVNEKLISTNYKESYFNYYKIKECLDSANICSFTDTNKVLHQIENTDPELSYDSILNFRSTVEFWNSTFDSHSLYFGASLLRNIPIEYADYFSLAFIAGKLRYQLKNTVSYNELTAIQNGLEFAANQYTKNRKFLPSINTFNKIEKLRTKGKLRRWTYRKLRRLI